MNGHQKIPDPALAKKFFETGNTKTYAFRRAQLLALKNAITRFEEKLHLALFTDLKKSPEESWVTETGFVMAELNASLRALCDWMNPERVSTNLVNLPSSSYIMREPLGVVLIISPWNYPFNLLFAPLIGAIAAGNCVVLKPSEFAPATAAVIKQLVEETFEPDYIMLAEGDGATVVPALINSFRFDHIFYTGSTAIGKIIYQLAAKELVPVTLELGGKSPCIVESDANIEIAARRIAMAKFSNAGQMCVAPDYILVHQSKKEKLQAALKDALNTFFKGKAEESESYGKIINEKQFDRLIQYLGQGNIAHGGRHNKPTLFIEPTILENVSTNDSVMQEEIFGPILPVLSFSTDEEAMAIIAKNQNPLAFYIFTSDRKKEKKWLEAVPAGGACVNNCSWHLTNHHLPFGGRGNSGTGHYHGRFSFETFSHRKSVLKTPTWFDPLIKYPPFKGKLKLFKWVIR